MTPPNPNRPHTGSSHLQEGTCRPSLESDGLKQTYMPSSQLPELFLVKRGAEETARAQACGATRAICKISCRAGPGDTLTRVTKTCVQNISEPALYATMRIKLSRACTPLPLTLSQHNPEPFLTLPAMPQLTPPSKSQPRLEALLQLNPLGNLSHPPWQKISKSAPSGLMK